MPALHSHARGGGGQYVFNTSGKGILDVKFTLKGKGFPAFQSFIEDSKGQKIMLGTFAPESKGKILRLALEPGEITWGSNRMKIDVDGAGNFTGTLKVLKQSTSLWDRFFGNDEWKNYNIKDWNKNKQVNQLQVVVIKRFSKLVITTLLFMGMGCTKTLEKECWIFPCDYTGTLTVYFRDISHQDTKEKNRVYRFNKKGVFYSNSKVNEGFTPDFNQTLSFMMDCDHIKRKIPYYQDSLKAKKGEIYATYFLSGEDSLTCESVLIAIKK